MSDHIRRGRLHPMQVWQLRQPITANRVLKDGKGMSHLSQQDVVAHLTRVFGFGNFDTEILDLTMVYEERVPNPKNPNFDPNALKLGLAFAGPDHQNHADEQQYEGDRMFESHDAWITVERPPHHPAHPGRSKSQSNRLRGR